MEVVPLDAHALLFILREVLTAEAKGHRGQETLRKRLTFNKLYTLNLKVKIQIQFVHLFL